jgi:hypothetical protein
LPGSFRAIRPQVSFWYCIGARAECLYDGSITGGIIAIMDAMMTRFPPHKKLLHDKLAQAAAALELTIAAKAPCRD